MAAVGVLGACASNPGARTVAEDMIDALPDLTDDQRACMRRELDATTNEDIEAIAQAGAGVDFGATDAVERTGEPFQAFVERLNSTCMIGG
ncbi:MAG: hypothetical protein ACRDZ2_13920 [Ilumatobacteraceae bacterium]